MCLQMNLSSLWSILFCLFWLLDSLIWEFIITSIWKVASRLRKIYVHVTLLQITISLNRFFYETE